MIQVTTSTYGKAGSKPIDYLNEQGIEFRTNPYGRKLTEDEAIELLADVEGVIAGTEPLTKNVLSKLPDLKVISRCGTGMNNVDLEYAKERGIPVLNTPDVHVDAVAELALAGTLCLLRNIVSGDQEIRDGNWNKVMGMSIYNKNIGLIGFGKVGRKFAELLYPMTGNIFYYDPFVDFDESRDAESVELDKLLSISDVISIHVPYTDENHYMIGEEELNMCKSTVKIINTSRGGLIDEESLYKFLKNTPQAGAYLDVFENEPYDGPLKELKNMVLTPHTGTSSMATREEMEYQAAVNLVKAFNK